MLELVAVFANAGDQIALVGLLKTPRHFFAQAEAAAVVAIRVMEGSLERAGIHGGELEGVRNSMGLHCSGWVARGSVFALQGVQRVPRRAW